MFRGFLQGLRDEISGLTSAPRPVVRERPTTDLVVGAIFLIVCTAVYGSFAWRLAQGDFLHYWNMGFDFDPSRFVVTLADEIGNNDRSAALGGVKHPLMVLFRPLGSLFLALGFDIKEAASLATALAGGATVAVVYGFLRLAGARRPEAVCFTTLYATSGAQIFCAMIVETYAFALLCITLVWTTTALRLEAPERLLRSRLLVGVLNFGVTVTNGLHTGVSELFLWVRQRGLARGISRTVAFLVVMALGVLVLAMPIWGSPMLLSLLDPVQALKEIYWLKPQGGNETGPAQVLLTFFGFSFLSPEFSRIPLPDGIVMWDFREFYSSNLERAAFGLWLVVLVGGVVASFTMRGRRGLSAMIALVLACNVVLHLDYQFRGSLYIYAAHSHFLVFSMLAGLAAFLSRRGTGQRVAGNAVILLLVILFAAVNFARASEFSRAFDDIQVPIDCQLPAQSCSR